MRYSGLQRSWAGYFTAAVIIAIGALFACFCFFIILIQSLVKLLIVPVMLGVGLCAVIWERSSENPHRS